MVPFQLKGPLELFVKRREFLPVSQGLTLKFQARSPKRSFDENKWSKAGFLDTLHIISGP